MLAEAVARRHKPEHRPERMQTSARLAPRAMPQRLVPLFYLGFCLLLFFGGVPV